MRIVCIGDSLTAGYGVLKKDCWVELIRNNLHIDIINKGINGDTTVGMLSRSYRDIIENHPSHVIIMGGCNDLMAGRSLNMIEENIKILVEEAIKYKIIPLIGIELPIDKALAQRKWSDQVDYTKVNNLLMDYKKWIMVFAKNCNVSYIDFYYCYQNNLKSINPRELYVDGLHPTALGHKLLANCVIDVFQARKLLL